MASGGSADVTETKEGVPEGDIHSYMCLGTRFDVPERYIVVDSVGQGAYGVVWYVARASPSPAVVVNQAAPSSGIV